MSFPGPSRGRDQGNGGVVMSAGRGAILVAVAIVCGLLVLAVVNNRGSSSTTTPATEVTLPTVPATNIDGTAVTTPPTTEGAGTTATTKKKKSTTTTAAAVKGARPNDQVVVQVLNGSGIQGAATTRSNDLKAQGYQTVPAGNAPSQRTGKPLEVPRADPPGGSTDVGDVSWVVPTLHLSVTTAPEAAWHAWPVVASGGMSIGHKGMMHAAKTLAATMVDLFEDAKTRAAIQAEFKEKTRGFVYKPYISDGPPPVPKP